MKYGERIDIKGLQLDGEKEYLKIERLYTLLKSGVPIDEALKIVSEEYEDSE